MSPPLRPEPPDTPALGTALSEPLSLDPDEPQSPPAQAASPDNDGSPRPTPTRQSTASPIRVVATIAVVFIGVFLFLRVFLVEPFGVPTGSMAPTLIGNHREGPCPRCGYPILVGSVAGRERAGHFANVPCPNCGTRIDLSDARELNGDRLLVDKNVFRLRRPRRWEVAVFHCPADQSKPYVKRVIGLPGEVIVIEDGDIYTVNRESQAQELVRKSLAEVREARLPVFDLAYPPVPGGWGPWWLVSPPDRDPRLPRQEGRLATPADPSVLIGGAIILDAAASPEAELRVEYLHWNLDTSAEEAVLSWNGYDGAPSSRAAPAHDFSLRCVVEARPNGREGRFGCRLFDGADIVTADMAVGPRGAGESHLIEDKRGGLASAQGVGLEPGRAHVVEFALVDRRATIAVDGRVVVAPVDLPPERKRLAVKRPLQLFARGCRVEVRELKLYRDIHYTQAGTHGTQAPARLGPDEYFMLGDNSGNSQDSREWPTPGVPEADFIGKPFLIHQPLRLGRVTVGGQERVFQAIDWSRLRWLH